VRPVTKSPVILLTPRDGSRRILYNVPPGVDRIYISPSGTTADISKIRIIVDDGDVLDLSEFVPAEMIFPPPKRIVLEWDPSEDGKTIQFLFGREYYKRAITYTEVVKSWDVAPRLDTIISQLPTLRDDIKRNIELTYIAPQTVTSSGDSGANPLVINYGSVVVFFLNVSNVGGTDPTLNVYIDIQDPASGAWVNQDKFPTVTSTGTWALALPVRAVKYRVRWVLGGTNPSFTFSIGVVIIK
jgi:hypothetical protein